MSALCDSLGSEAPWSLWLSDAPEAAGHDSDRSPKNRGGLPAQLRRYRKQIEERSALRLKHSAYHADLRLIWSKGQRHRAKKKCLVHKQKQASNELSKEQDETAMDSPRDEPVLENKERPVVGHGDERSPGRSSHSKMKGKEQALRPVKQGDGITNKARFQQRRVASAFQSWSAILLQKFGSSGYEDAVEFLKSQGGDQVKSQEGLQQLCVKLGLNSDDASLVAHFEGCNKPTLEQLVQVGMSVGNSLYPGMPKLVPEQAAVDVSGVSSNAEDSRTEPVVAEPRKQVRRSRPWHAPLAPGGPLPRIASITGHPSKLVRPQMLNDQNTSCEAPASKFALERSTHGKEAGDSKTSKARHMLRQQY